MRFFAPLTLSLLILIYATESSCTHAQSESRHEMMLEAQNFGVIGDGLTDDGPAIKRAFTQLCQQDRPTTLRFEPNKTYRIRSVNDTRLFRVEDRRDITIDGRGSTFLLHGDVRFITIQRSKNIEIRDLTIDYNPLPFVDAMIIAKAPDARTIDVRIPAPFAMPPLGGPTRQGGEQDYFGMLWTDGPYSLIGHHLYVLDMQRTSPDRSNVSHIDDRTVRVTTDFTRFDLIQPNVHTISLPVRGIAHRALDGATVRIVDNENVDVKNLTVHSAPWFAFQIIGNRGKLTFQNVDLRPKQGTDRRTSAWRDGFHVKSNRADLLFENCHLEGMNDDAMNIATHMSRVVRVIADDRIEVRQLYPLNIVAFEPGDKITLYRTDEARTLGTAELIQSTGKPTTQYVNGRPQAPTLTLQLDRPIVGLQPGDRLWNVSSANPNTVIRNCRIFNSCRFQSPVTIERCEITAFCWFRSMNVEGPIPSQVTIRDSVLRLGRGNPQLVASFDGTIHRKGATTPNHIEPSIQHVLIEGNTIDGQINFTGIQQLILRNNRLINSSSKLQLRDCKNVRLEDNYLDDVKLNDLSQLSIHDEKTRESVTIKNTVPP